ELHLSPKTVDTYRSRLRAKLELADVPALVRWAIREKLIELCAGPRAPRERLPRPARAAVPGIPDEHGGDLPTSPGSSTSGQLRNLRERGCIRHPPQRRGTPCTSTTQRRTPA